MSGTPASRAGRVVLRIALAAVGVGFAGWLVWRIDTRELLEVAARANPWWLLLSLIPLMARFVLWGAKWALMLRPRSGPGTLTAIRLIVAGAFVNMVTPFAKLAGGLFRAALLRRVSGWRFSTAYGWTLADQAQNILASLMLFGLLAVASSGGTVVTDPDPLLALAGAAVLGAGILFLMSKRFLWRKISSPGSSWVRWNPLLRIQGRDEPSKPPPHEELLRPVLAEGGSAVVTARDLGLAALSWFCLCVANAMVFRSLGVEGPLLRISAVLVLGAFAGSITGMGGIGTTEAALIALYTRAGIAPAHAAAAALLHRASFYLVVLAWGGLSFLNAGRSSRSGGAEIRARDRASGVGAHRRDRWNRRDRPR